MVKVYDASELIEQDRKNQFKQDTTFYEKRLGKLEEEPETKEHKYEMKDNKEYKRKNCSIRFKRRSSRQKFHSEECRVDWYKNNK